MLSLFDHIPSQCPVCGQRSRGRRLCPGCRYDWRLQQATPRCRRCALPLSDAGGPCWPCLREPPPFDATIAAMGYEAPYDRLIGMLKDQHRLWMARCLAQLIGDVVQQQTLRQPMSSQQDARSQNCRLLRAARADMPDMPDVLVPIPSGQASLKRRGFNPAGEIARELARLTGRRLARAGALRRTRDSPKQSELGRSARLRESIDLFQAHSSFTGLHVCLVDDVMTTGGTLGAAAWAVRDAGATRVTVWVAARTAEGAG